MNAWAIFFLFWIILWRVRMLTQAFHDMKM
jgi:hypothetical protein